MANGERLTEEQIKNGWFSCGMNIDSFNAPVADKFGDVIAFVRKIEEYTENRCAQPALEKITTTGEVPVKVRAKSGPKPGWKQRKAAEEAAKNVG